MARKPKGYWEKRSTALMQSLEKGTESTIGDLAQIYNNATRNINAEIARIFKNYSKDVELTPEVLTGLLNKKETDIFYKNLLKVINNHIDDEDLKKKLLTKYNAPAYAYRLKRYQALQEYIDVEMKKTAGLEEKITKERYIKTIEEGYYHNIFDMQKGLGYNFDFSQLDMKTINLLLKEKWTNKGNFSTRIWENNTKLSNYLQTQFTADMMTGKSIYKMSRELDANMNVGIFNAIRLVRTEVNHFSNEAEMLSYEECGIEKYKFIATLDARTCGECAKLDNKVFEVAKRKAGVNYPPLHPLDRCTTIAVVDEEVTKGLQRRARDVFNGNTELISNMSYQEWEKNHNDNYLTANKNGIWSFNYLKNQGIRDNFINAHKIINLDIKENKDIYDNIDKLKIRVYNSGLNSPHYNPATNSVYLPDSVNARNSGTTIHEVGHAIDFKLGEKLKVGQLSKSGKLTSLIDEYYEKNKNILPKELQDYKEKINKKVSKLTGAVTDYDIAYQRRLLAQKNYKYDAPNRLCDMYSSLTKGIANHELFASHPRNYWKNDGVRETELYAQFTYLKMTNSKKELEVLEKTVPKIYNELNRLYKKASKEMRKL